MDKIQARIAFNVLASLAMAGNNPRFAPYLESEYGATRDGFKSLEARGLITHAQDDMVVLTPLGRQIAERLTRTVQNVLDFPMDEKPLIRITPRS